MIIDQKLTIWILNRKQDNPIEGYLARGFEVQILCQYPNILIGIKRL